MSAEGFVHLDVERVLHATPKALRLRLRDGRSVWVPRSVVADADDYRAGDANATVSIRDDWAEREGLAEP